MVRNYAFAGTTLLVMLLSGVALAQVPPDIAAGIRKIGPIVDAPNTAKLYRVSVSKSERALCECRRHARHR